MDRGVSYKLKYIYVSESNLSITHTSFTGFLVTTNTVLFLRAQNARCLSSCPTQKPGLCRW